MSDEPNPVDPNSVPHPNPEVYETCSSCGDAYKLISGDCTNCNS